MTSILDQLDEPLGAQEWSALETWAEGAILVGDGIAALALRACRTFAAAKQHQLTERTAMLDTSLRIGEMKSALQVRVEELSLALRIREGQVAALNMLLDRQREAFRDLSRAEERAYYKIAVRDAYIDKLYRQLRAARPPKQDIH